MEETAILTAVISAAAGLGGVGIGAWATGRHQKKQRQQDWIREQLDEFYAPMLGLRAWILATSELRLKMSGAMDESWRRLVRRARPDIGRLRQLQEKRFPDFRKVIEENNRQFVEEILPKYEEMVELFRQRMALAEPSTREHFGALVEFVEVWKRWLDDTVPPEMLDALDHGEVKLYPLYNDLADEFERLQQGLRE